MKKPISKFILFAGLAVPLQSPDNWQILKYSKLPAHKVDFNEKAMNIAVTASAGPIVYPLKTPQMVSGVKVQGNLNQLISFKEGQVQGAKKLDDYTLRVGLVVAGSKTLGFSKRLFAPKWVKTLFSLAPKSTGIDHIYFVNATQQKAIQNTSRTHPLSKLIKETNPWLLDKPGPFKFEHKFKENIKVLALWIAIDGDDTKSNFNVDLEKLELDIK